MLLDIDTDVLKRITAREIQHFVDEQFNSSEKEKRAHYKNYFDEILKNENDNRNVAIKFVPKIEEEFHIVRILGKGSFGYTFLVHGINPKNRATHGKTFTLKLYFNDHKGEYLTYVLNLNNYMHSETQAYANLLLHNVVQIRGIYFFDELCCSGVLYDYIEGKSLDHYALASSKTKTSKPRTKQEVLTPEEAFFVGYQLMCNLIYFHDLGLSHRDIKPANVVYSKKHKTVTIIDYDFMCFNDAKKIKYSLRMCRTKAGSQSYMHRQIRQYKWAVAERELVEYDWQRNDVHGYVMTMYKILLDQKFFVSSAVGGNKKYDRWIQKIKQYKTQFASMRLHHLPTLDELYTDLYAQDFPHKCRRK